MKLNKGQAAEYKRRHDEIWTELSALLKSSGIAHYSIFLDPQTHHLFGVLEIDDPSRLDQLPAREVMQRWWKYMSDIMESNPDLSPASVPLEEVFYLE